KRWRVLPGDIQAEAQLQIELGAHPIMARLLVQRGLTTPEAADAFLNPSLDRLHDPFLLPDAEAACARLKQALAQNEKILVHGDYDGDGVTSAALWTRCLRALGANVDVFVPHRGRDGYDMRKPFIERAKEEGVTLIVTTDCGIQRVDEVEQARQYGIDVIITDHHTPNSSGELPQAVAVVNPQRADSRYPFRHLAGVGVAFKLCEALTRYLGKNVDGYRRGFLDLAAIGTITDVMPLVDENRIIVKYGLEALEKTKKPGLQALIEVAGYAGKPLDTRAIGFGLGPRINSASRIDETQLALDLLLTKDEAHGQHLARRLNELNAQRKEIQDRIFEEAMAQVALQDSQEARCLVISSDGWAGSVIGIVASKIVERAHRPCVMIALDTATGTGRGSARSIHAFNIFDAIHACRDLLIEYGGHAHAAGLSIECAHVEDFAAQMKRLAKSLLTEDDCVPTVEASSEIGPSEINPQLLNQIASLAPFGNDNQEPLFISRSVPALNVERMGKEGQHLRMTLRAEGLNGKDSVQAPWFWHGDVADALESGSSLDVCYKPQFNDWNGRRSIQFMIEDIQPPEW
ncbi:MAG TPA: single-stranded-DNA-specific exonuclease RecJ, partial [Chthonomonadaceae bacterium]|nr:single-stranded-DNA-specific exonuclease RecJ [Chthonomonadaceae bacterium]